MPAREQPPAEPRTLRDPVTGCRIRQLTAGPAHHWPLAGPDTPLTPAGDHLLFLSSREGEPLVSLFRLGMRSGAVHPVTDTDRLLPGGITPAANGRQAISLLRGEEGEVAAIDLETGEWETLAVFLDAELAGCHRSASGEYVVTTVTQGSEAVITAVHTEGMRTVPILEGPRGIHAARFSPDSKNSVLYVTGEPPEIRCVEFDGTGDRVLCSGVQAFRPGTREAGDGVQAIPGINLSACDPIWRGSGGEVLYIAGGVPGPVEAVPRQGGPPREVVSVPCVWLRSDARGERLVAVAPAGAGEGEPLAAQIILIDAGTGEQTPLVSECSAWAAPCFSPEGESVVYAGTDEQGFTQIYQVLLHEG